MRASRATLRELITSSNGVQRLPPVVVAPDPSDTSYLRNMAVKGGRVAHREQVRYVARDADCQRAGRASRNIRTKSTALKATALPHAEPLPPKEEQLRKVHTKKMIQWYKKGSSSK